MPRPDSRLPCFARPANFSTTIILHRHPSSLAPLGYPFFFPSLFLTVVCSRIISTPRIERFLLSEVLPAQANLAKVPWFNPRPSSPLSLCPLRVVSAYSSIHDLRSRNVKKGLGGCFIPLLRNRYVYCFLPDRLSRTPSPPFRPVSLLLHRSSACSPPLLVALTDCLRTSASSSRNVNCSLLEVASISNLKPSAFLRTHASSDRINT